MTTPDDRRYTEQHEWALLQPGGGEGTVVRVGITDHAQDALGDVVFVQLPAVGDTVTAGEPCGEVESTKSVNDVYAPVSGEVVARNEALEQTPELVNSDPYGEGWLLEIKVSDPSVVQDLLSSADYSQQVG